jgi:hypothetical protein
MNPAVRKLTLTVHLTTSVGWIGAVIAYLALGVLALDRQSTETVRAAWIAMDITGWWAIVPLAIAALLTGLVLSMGTPWGLFRHYWVVISLILTVFCTAVLLMHMPSVSANAGVARLADEARVDRLGGDLMHPGVGLLILLAIAALNVYKPAGLTPYGWRKQQEQRQTLRRSTLGAVPTASPASVPSIAVRRTSRLGTVVTGAGSFFLYFAEMGVAMMVGMMVFMPVRPALVALGDTALREADSVDFQLWMAAFMILPMVTWMRARGCSWRDGVEMGVGMLVPAAAIVVLRGLGLSETLPWLSNSEHMAMLCGMLAVMLYRRERYTRGHWLMGTPAAVGSQSSDPAISRAS